MVDMAAKAKLSTTLPVPHTTRRESLQWAALATVMAGCGKSMLAKRPSDTPAAPPTRDQLLLWYDQPASQWTEALPVGSGRLGAMIFGGAGRERLQLNEDTLWAGGPYDPDNTDALPALSEIRRLIFAGQYRQAEELAKARMMAKPLTQMPYQTVGDLLLGFPGVGTFEHYRRELCLDRAVARTTFSSGGVTLEREIFASAVDQVIVVRLSNDKPGSLDFDVSMQTPEDATLNVEPSGTLNLHGRNHASAGVAAALVFEARVLVLPSDGTIGAENGAITVRAATSATLLIACATSYRNYRDSSGDPAPVVTRRLAAAREKGFERLLADHVDDHQRIFQRVSIDLGTSAAAHLPTDERVRRSSEVDDPDLAALYFQYGRYLLASCSRPGSQPANLQGLWNDSLTPPWGCKYTININTEMNYWPVDGANLGECIEPLLLMVEDLAKKGAETARVHYAARGWVAHHNTDLWRAAAPIDGPKWGLWPTGGAWLCMTLWDHYDYTRDQRFLAKLYPLMKGAAEFFLDTLVEEPKNKWLVTCPSLSPENVHPGGSSLCAGPSMDEQILRDLFTRSAEAAEILGIDAGFRSGLREAAGRLAPHQIGASGQLQEWLEDWDLDAPEIHHRHVSHLYGLFPSGQITVERTPSLAAAARRSLEIRGDDATGWGLAWRLNLWARLGDGEHAHRILRMLLGPERTYPNLFDAHPPFQIDGNFGGVSGICEMLVQSHGGVIRLLPALPNAWPTGSVRGLVARGGFGVDVAWKRGMVDTATIRGKPGAIVPVRYAGRDVTVTVGANGSVRLTREGDALRAT
jgi:alpha-L-fucosidase 2